MCFSRGVLRAPVAAKPPFQSSAWAVVEPLLPPVRRTVLLASRVAVCPKRAESMAPASEKVAREGLKICEELSGDASSRPPAMRTRPSGRRVLVWAERGPESGAVGEDEPATTVTVTVAEVLSPASL